MSKKCTGRALIFRSNVGHHSISAKRRHFRHIHSGAMSAIVKIKQAVCQSFPECEWTKIEGISEEQRRQMLRHEFEKDIFLIDYIFNKYLGTIVWDISLNI